MTATQTYRWRAQPALSGAVTALIDKTRSATGAPPPFIIAWWCFAAAVSASNILHFFPTLPAPATYLLAVAGSAGCAWGWLMARTLFRPAHKIERWAFIVVAGVLIVEASWTLIGMHAAAPPMTEAYRIAGNAAALVCISALFLVLFEAVSGFNGDLAPSERRFRLQFIAGYGVLIIVSMVWAMNAPEGTFAGHWQDAALAGCGFGAIILSRLAVNFRLNNPLPVAVLKARRAPSAVADDERLTRLILETIADDAVFTTPNLKVAAFADMLGEQEYKVTQCVTGALNYRNFNQLVNEHRICRARSMLSTMQHDHESILTIAYGCGFNSIGPFNRAFKQETGMTPSEFRASAKRERSGPAPVC